MLEFIEPITKKQISSLTLFMSQQEDQAVAVVEGEREERSVAVAVLVLWSDVCKLAACVNSSAVEFI